MNKAVGKLDFVIGLFAALLLLVGLSQLLPIRAAVKRTSNSTVGELQSVFENSTTLDARWFWQWRDETNGVFRFDTATTRAGMTRRILEPTTDEWLLHSFSSQLIAASTDTLLRTKNSQDTILSDLITTKINEYPTLINKGTDFVILVDANHTKVLLLFVKDSKELIAVDGLFDFIDTERKFLEESFWVSTTYINV